MESFCKHAFFHVHAGVLTVALLSYACSVDGVHVTVCMQQAAESPAGWVFLFPAWRTIRAVHGDRVFFLPFALD